jgi:hypothetical protein
MTIRPKLKTPNPKRTLILVLRRIRIDLTAPKTLRAVSLGQGE